MNWNIDYLVCLRYVTIITRYFRFTADKLDDTKQYLIDLSVNVCFDGTCTNVPILTNAVIPIPLCGDEAVITLPGDGTIGGYVQQLADEAGDEGIMMLLHHFNLQVCCCI